MTYKDGDTLSGEKLQVLLFGEGDWPADAGSTIKLTEGWWCRMDGGVWQFFAHKCRFCKGQRGGTPGNENIIHGMIVCDYCSADISKVERAVRRETLRAAKRVALFADPGILGCTIADQIESTQFTEDGRWKSSEAMALWARATDTTGEDLHEIYDGNGRERHRG